MTAQRWRVHVHYSDRTTGYHPTKYASKRSARRAAVRLETTGGIKSAALEPVVE